MGIRQFPHRRAAGAACALVIILANASAFAQDDVESVDDGYEEESGVEEIIVTGSRLRRRDFNAPSPITSVDGEQLRNSGQANVEAALNQMPQVTPSINRSTNNGSTGGAHINLRGMGNQRTLVMLNGRRLSPSGIGSAVDVNNLPQVLIDRVEIITGGATTVYGSDAVSGVINFITRTDFEGFGLDATAYMTEEGDANTYDINLTYGHNFSNGRGNITAYFGYLDREELLADQRELTSVPWMEDWVTGELVQSGSSRVPEGAIVFPFYDYGAGPGETIFEANGDPRELIRPEDLYNWAPWNYIQTPLERYTGGFFFNYELTSRTELYMEGAYTQNRHRSVLAPTPASGFFAFNIDNPLMTPATQQVFSTFIPLGPNLVGAVLRRRLEEFGPRITENEKDYMRIVAGIRGDAWSDWQYDAWVTYTDADEPQIRYNDGSRSRLQQGLLVDPATGQCFDPSNGCVPINVFGAGNLTQEMIEFLRLDPLRNETTREQILASAFVRGPLFETWDGAVESAFGVEWRRDDGNFEADPVLFNFDTLAFGPTAPVAGVEEVVEVFGELLIPLADTRRFADYLALELGGRISEYKNAGDSTTWKVGLDWRPISSLRFRGMYQKSVRAPNLLEAFQEEYFSEFTVGEDPTDDPCSAVSNPVAAGNRDKCIATGLPADQIGVWNATAQEVTEYFGGNPDLDPEEAETVTLGVVIAPESVPNMQLAIDYFDLRLDGAISELDTFLACFDGANTGAIYCDRMSRDPITLNVNEVRSTNINAGEQRTTGVDTQLSIGFELPRALAIGDSFADLDVRVSWTHITEFSDQFTPYATVRKCAGYWGWGCGDPNGWSFPKDRVTTNFVYSSENFAANLTWQWIGGTKSSVTNYSGDFGFPDPNLAIPYISSKNYVDLGLSYRFNDNIEARLTVANLLDESAPMMADTVLDQNTDSSMYDVYGRAYTLGFSLTY